MGGRARGGDLESQQDSSGSEWSISKVSSAKENPNLKNLLGLVNRCRAASY